MHQNQTRIPILAVPAGPSLLMDTRTVGRLVLGGIVAQTKKQIADCKSYLAHKEERCLYQSLYRIACHKKVAANQHSWRERNPEKVVANNRRHYWADPEKSIADACAWAREHPQEVNARNRRWAKNHPEEIKAKNLRYRKAHPEVYAAIRARRDAKKAKNGGSWTVPEWLGLCMLYDFRCLSCGTRNRLLTPDHVVPVDQGGTSHIDNIQPLCGHCNDSKGHIYPVDHRWPEWALLRYWSGELFAK